MRFVYSVVRYVPNPATGEFVNIGAIAGSDETGDWSLRRAGNPRRARLFGPLESLNAVDAFMNDIGSRLDTFALMQSDDISEAWLSELQNRQRNVVQLSVPAPVIADSAEEALEFVFSQVITDDSNAAGGLARGYATRLRLFSELRTSYRRANIRADLIREKSVVSTDGLHAPMDFVVGNGVAVQLAHTWSFQIQSLSEVAKDVKSWGFTVERLQKYGGRTSGENPAEIPVGVPVDVVFAPPITMVQEDAFTEAERVFGDLGVTTVRQEDVARVASEARKQLQARGIAIDLLDSGTS
jgi:Protein of unknown function (DUF3037)